jgi:hypothetical protein
MFSTGFDGAPSLADMSNGCQFSVAQKHQRFKYACRTKLIPKKGDEIMPKAELSLEVVHIATMPAVLNLVCIVKVTLTNNDSVAQIVNRRMAVGYRDTLARELFGDLTNIASGLPANISVVDYDRNFSSPSDYISLPPGQSIERSFDLFEWYAPTKPGTYRLTMHYQADEKLARAPQNVVKGIYTSEPVTLEVTG